MAATPHQQQSSGHSHGHGHGHGRGHGHGHDRQPGHGHESMYGLARHAALYNLHAGLVARPLYQRIQYDVAAAGLPDGSLVVDAGTGPGRVPLLIAQAGPGLRVEGFDPSPEMIEFATAKAAAIGYAAQRLRFRIGDVAALPYPDASVDLVVSSLSLHHWADPAAGLREIGRVLRPGGTAWIYDFRRVLLAMEPEARAAVPGRIRVDVEPRLDRAWRINPLGRLVLSA
jgi:SAM-dependent methyltransferase